MVSISKQYVLDIHTICCTILSDPELNPNSAYPMNTVTIYSGTLANIGFALFTLSCILQHAIGALQAPMAQKGQGTLEQMKPTRLNNTVTTVLRVLSLIFLSASVYIYFTEGSYFIGSVIFMAILYLNVAILLFKATFPFSILPPGEPSNQNLVLRWEATLRTKMSYFICIIFTVMQYALRYMSDIDRCKISTLVALTFGIFCLVKLHPDISNTWWEKGHNIDGDGFLEEEAYPE